MNIDLRSLKATHVGDLIVVMLQSATPHVVLLEMTAREGHRGAHGRIDMTFKNLVSGRERHVVVQNELPSEWKFVRRVSRGCNARTLNRLMTAASVPGTDSGEANGSET